MNKPITYKKLGRGAFVELIENTQNSMYKQILIGAMQDEENNTWNKAGMILSKLGETNITGYKIGLIDENKIVLMKDNNRFVGMFSLNVTDSGIAINDYKGEVQKSIQEALNICEDNNYKKYYLSEIFEIGNFSLNVTYYLNKITDFKEDASKWANEIDTNSLFKIVKSNGELELQENNESFFRIKDIRFNYKINNKYQMVSQNIFFEKANNEIVDGVYFLEKKSVGLYHF